jgi:hypothetical protein
MASRNYLKFLESKKVKAHSAGFAAERDTLNPMLFDFQKDIVGLNLKRGKSATFSDCGTGKGPMQFEWARQVHLHTGGNVLVLAPLAVSQQMVREAQKFGVAITPCATQADVRSGVNVTNYEKLHHFNPGLFAGVSLDESSCLKGEGSKTREYLIQAFSDTPFRSAWTATPAPNDYMELGYHAEFLGVMRRSEMLAMFFEHDGGDTSKWKLKGHAEKSKFWEWLCSWAVTLRRPSDLGYADDGFALSPIEMHHHVIKSDVVLDGMLFPVEAQTLEERRKARRGSIAERAAQCAKMVNASADTWVIWCDLNAEGDLLERLIPGSVQVKGSDSAEFKEQAMLDFSEGRIRVLITKPTIAGFGMNWQHCSHTAFVGLSDSFEQVYQAIRRFWRFGQIATVHCHFFTADTEGAVVKNIQRKERQALEMADAMVRHMNQILRGELRGDTRNTDRYEPIRPMQLPSWIATQAA